MTLIVRCYFIVFTKLYNYNVANVNFDVNFIYLIFHDFNICTKPPFLLHLSELES